MNVILERGGESRQTSRATPTAHRARKDAGAGMAFPILTSTAGVVAAIDGQHPALAMIPCRNACRGRRRGSASLPMPLVVVVAVAWFGRGD